MSNESVAVHPTSRPAPAPDHTDELHVLLGQLRGLAWWLSDFRGDFEIDPEAVRNTGMLIERMATEAKRHVEAMELASR